VEPDLTLDEVICAMRENQIPGSRTAVWRFFQRHKITFKKNLAGGRDLPAHKAAGVREAIEARGATLRYLPKYSPDLNPIEMSFSRLKAYLRKAGERTIPRLRRRLGWFARNVTAREAANYFTHAGYA
jgi:transposase